LLGSLLFKGLFVLWGPANPSGETRRRMIRKSFQKMGKRVFFRYTQSKKETKYYRAAS